MKALIDPNGTMCQMVAATFPVAAGFKWVDCPKGAAMETHRFDGTAIVPRTDLLVAAKGARRAEIDRARDAACVAPVEAHGRLWQADPRSQQMLAAAILLAGTGLPLPRVWRDAANNDKPIAGLSDLLSIAAAIAVQTETAYATSWARKAALDACATLEDVEAV